MHRFALIATLALMGCPEGPDDPEDTGTECDGPLTYLDADGDGFGDPETGACSPDSSRVDNDSDCNDADDAVNPDASERCDGVDTNCDGGEDTDGGHPVCDDALEDNDDLFEASEGVSADGLVALQGDPDFFVVPVCVGRDTEVSVDFDNALGNLDVRVYDRLGDEIALLDSDADSESITLTNPGTVASYTVIEVFARSGELNSNVYALDITQGPGTCANTATPANVEAVFGDDVVLNTGSGLDPEQDHMDIDGNVLMTQNVSGNSAALPNDGVFPETADHPTIQLPYNDADDGPNARILASGESQTVFLPALPFERLHVLGTSTDGSSDVTMVIEADGVDILTEDLLVRDWFGSTPSAGSYALITGMRRFDFDDDFADTRENFSVWGHALVPAQAGTASTVRITNDGPGNYVLMGVSLE